jgi:hypothetical protein
MMFSGFTQDVKKFPGGFKRWEMDGLFFSPAAIRLLKPAAKLQYTK